MPSTPARDVPGPRPENQRKRTELQGPRQALIGLLAVAAVLAVAGGVALLGRSLVVHTPLLSLRANGLVLALVIGGTQALAAVLLVLHHERARAAALVAALIAVGWSVVQMMLLQDATWFQGTMFGVGALEAFLVAGCTPRKSLDSKKLRRRR
ncbi:MAG: hypothetical protein JWP01_3564 [Myxococcales bacterium]|nr:hypothetical protein [Myxococcales bacterium]